MVPSRRLHCNLPGLRTIAKALFKVRVPPGPSTRTDRLAENPGGTLNAEHFLARKTAMEERGLVGQCDDEASAVVAFREMLTNGTPRPAVQARPSQGHS